jgi:lipoprotein-releasing system permease protein
MLKLFLWLRYLRKRRIVLLSIAAVTFSCALLIVVASLFGGFINAFEQSAVDAMGDVVVSPPARFSRYPELIERLEQTSAVEAATVTLTAQGLIHLGAGNVRAVEIWGIEPQKRGEVTGFRRSLLKGDDAGGGTSEVAGGYVGIGVLAGPDEKTDEYDLAAVKQMAGQEAVITTGSAAKAGDGEDRRFKRKTIKFTIADIVFTGVYYLDSRIVYLPIKLVQEAVCPDEPDLVADQVQIKLKRGVDAEVAIAVIRGVWERFAQERLGWDAYLIRETTIETARQMQSRYVAEVRKQMGVLLLIFGVVSLSVVLLIFCIFFMIVETRRKDIAIVKSCGAGSASVAVLFLGFGAFVGGIGSVLGAALGYIVTRNINTIEEWIRIVFGLKLWKSSVYMFSRIPNEVDWKAASAIAVCAVAAAAVGALVPAIAAAMTRPVNVLRYE